jgi:uncharacterized membrane protein
MEKAWTRRRWRFLMNCDEFLRLFREALDGKVSEQIINDNANYYRSYINSEIRKGKSEAEVLASLGDPRLLAKTIEESTKFATGEGDSYYEYDSTTGRYSGKYEESKGSQGVHIKEFNMPGWLLGIIVAIVVLFVVAIVFRVAFFLAPYIIAFMIIGFIVREIRKWINRY